jgi:prophage regulatory protein
MKRNVDSEMRHGLAGGGEDNISELVKSKRGRRPTVVEPSAICSRCSATRDQVPPNQTDAGLGFLRFPQVRSLVQLSRSTIWRLEKADKFPKRRQLSSRIVGWSAAEIRLWVQARLQAGVTER